MKKINRTNQILSFFQGDEMLGNTVLGIVFVSILGTIFHFVYDWTGQNPFAGLFFATNESTWEHMKLLFFPMLLYCILDYFLSDVKNPKMIAANCVGILSGTFAIPVIYYTYSGILGEQITILNLLTFYASVIFGFRVRYKALKSETFEKWRWVLVVMVILLMFCFFIFTFSPPDLGIFQEP